MPQLAVCVRYLFIVPAVASLGTFYWRSRQGRRWGETRDFMRTYVGMAEEEINKINKARTMPNSCRIGDLQNAQIVSISFTCCPNGQGACARVPGPKGPRLPRVPGVHDLMFPSSCCSVAQVSRSRLMLLEASSSKDPRWSQDSRGARMVRAFNHPRV